MNQSFNSLETSDEPLYQGRWLSNPEDPKHSSFRYADREYTDGDFPGFITPELALDEAIQWARDENLSEIEDHLVIAKITTEYLPVIVRVKYEVVK